MGFTVRPDSTMAEFMGEVCHSVGAGPDAVPWRRLAPPQDAKMADFARKSAKVTGIPVGLVPAYNVEPL